MAPMLKFVKDIKGDKVIWIVVVILCIFSLLAVYSSTGMLAYKKQHGNTEYYLFKHFLILIFGLILIFMMIFRPQGLIPESRHRLEMKEEEP